MGVPALFRWLQNKYPKIIQPVLEDASQAPSETNPNGFEVQNLYLDMNGIIHPCCHPQDKPPPKNETEMHQAIFAYLDRIMQMIRPRKVLYLAVDGVAPRAKMNQQRSRRFRAAQEAKIKKTLKEKEKELDGNDSSEESSHEGNGVFDTNVITPGTKFMANISKALRFWTAGLLSKKELWSTLTIIISDSSVPGEGEHKIIDYIHRQRTCHDYDPNATHVIYGLDADLIMLSMGTHEPRFKVLREDIFWEERQKFLARQSGGTPVSTSSTTSSLTTNSTNLTNDPTKPFIFLDVIVLREYLDVEMRTSITNNRQLEPERCLDDWIMLCFLVGNDFLPHLPSLDIREGAIDTLITIYRKNMANDRLGGHLTKNGSIDFEKLGKLLEELGNAEDEILARRMEREQRWLEGQARKQAEEEAAAGTKRKRPEGDLNEDDELPTDLVKLGQPGYRERYYEHKFGIIDPSSADSIKKISDICDKYLEGLAWVLGYYYQGVRSWKWFYPYHYAPFAIDLAEHLRRDKFLSPQFELGDPFRPFDQLMSVFPIASSDHLPQPFRLLMTESNSPIAHFYPEEFRIDLNGKKFAWQGVALLPFIDEKLLLETLVPAYKELDENSLALNRLGRDELWIGNENSLFGFIGCLEDSDGDDNDEDDGLKWQNIDPILSDGLNGQVSYKPLYPIDSTINPSESIDLEDVLCAFYRPPDQIGLFESKILPGFIPPPLILSDADRSAVATGKKRIYGNSGGNTMLRDIYDRETNREMRGYKEERPPHYQQHYNERYTEPYQSHRTGASSSVFFQPTPSHYQQSGQYHYQYGGHRGGREGGPHESRQHYTVAIILNKGNIEIVVINTEERTGIDKMIMPPTTDMIRVVLSDRDIIVETIKENQNKLGDFVTIIYFSLIAFSGL